ncbi:hypothetical protein CPB86DRAFT_791410 [Serendipita vermifera]|nr:hypothetical protein CPB86DRAFT_791410 [Serendipita vermifera]
MGKVMARTKVATALIAVQGGISDFGPIPDSLDNMVDSRGNWVIRERPMTEILKGRRRWRSESDYIDV